MDVIINQLTVYLRHPPDNSRFAVVPRDIIIHYIIKYIQLRITNINLDVTLDTTPIYDTLTQLYNQVKITDIRSHYIRNITQDHIYIIIPDKPDVIVKMDYSGRIIWSISDHRMIPNSKIYEIGDYLYIISDNVELCRHYIKNQYTSAALHDDEHDTCEILLHGDGIIKPMQDRNGWIVMNENQSNITIYNLDATQELHEFALDIGKLSYCIFTYAHDHIYITGDDRTVIYKIKPDGTFVGSIKIPSKCLDWQDDIFHVDVDDQCLVMLGKRLYLINCNGKIVSHGAIHAQYSILYDVFVGYDGIITLTAYGTRYIIKSGSVLSGAMCCEK